VLVPTHFGPCSIGRELRWTSLENAKSTTVCKCKTAYQF